MHLSTAVTTFATPVIVIRLGSHSLDLTVTGDATEFENILPCNFCMPSGPVLGGAGSAVAGSAASASTGPAPVIRAAQAKAHSQLRIIIMLSFPEFDSIV